MTLISAALVARRNERVYQLATSVANACNMRRSIELTGLGHRKYYRAQPDIQQRLRLQFDTIPVSKTRYQSFSAPAQKTVVEAINRRWSRAAIQAAARAAERELEKVIKLISLYEPFILHNEQVFESDNVQLLTAALPPDERARVRLRRPRARLVGLLDQRPHSGAAQVVLSADRRASTGGSSPAFRAAGTAARRPAPRKRRARLRRRRPDIQVTWPSS